VRHRPIEEQKGDVPNIPNGPADRPADRPCGSALRIGRRDTSTLSERIEKRLESSSYAFREVERLSLSSDSLRQRVGRRLMSELPPAQGATVMKQLFI